MSSKPQMQCACSYTTQTYLDFLMCYLESLQGEKHVWDNNAQGRVTLFYNIMLGHYNRSGMLIGQHT